MLIRPLLNTIVNPNTVLRPRICVPTLLITIQKGSLAILDYVISILVEALFLLVGLHCIQNSKSRKCSRMAENRLATHKNPDNCTSTPDNCSDMSKYMINDT